MSGTKVKLNTVIEPLKWRVKHAEINVFVSRNMKALLFRIFLVNNLFGM